MLSFSTPAPSATPVQESVFPLKLAIALALAAVADWLFYDQRIGLSVVVFAVALPCGFLLANFGRLNRKRSLAAGILLLAGLAPAVEEVNAVSLGFIALTLGVGLLLATNRRLDGLGERASALCDLLLIGPYRFFRDIVGMFNLPALTNGFVLWFVPAVLGTVFAFLFVSANPLIEKWISLPLLTSVAGGSCSGPSRYRSSGRSFMSGGGRR